MRDISARELKGHNILAVTSGTLAIGYRCQSIGYQKRCAICRRTYGKETKAETDNPHLPMLNANWGCPKQERQPKEVKIRLWL